MPGRQIIQEESRKSMGGLFDKQSGHPLADKRELQRIIGELPADNAFKALDET